MTKVIFAIMMSVFCLSVNAQEKTERHRIVEHLAKSEHRAERDVADYIRKL